MTKKVIDKNLDKEKRLGLRTFYDLRALIIGGNFQYVDMFYKAGIKGATSLEDADFVVFTGGEDVDPRYYNEAQIPATFCNPARDAFEAEIYSDVVKLGKPMIGICRGSQFLNVMNGGTLWQDVNNHAVMGGHDIVDMRTGETIPNMTSTHHQMMRPHEQGEIIALAALSTRKECAVEVVKRAEPELDDVEVVWYPETSSLCFQPHPEFHENECRDYFLELLDEYVIPAC